MKKREKLFSITASDCTFTAKRGSGKGGQKRNKTSNAIQCFHEPSGAMGEAEDHREQSQNRKIAFDRMAKSSEFQAWLKLKIEAALGHVEIEEQSALGNPIIRKLGHEEV